MFARLRRHDRRDAARRLPPPVARRADGPASDDGAGLTIVLNPAAGSSNADEVIAVLGRELPAAQLVVVTDDLTLDRALDRARPASVLGIVGGDGSINAAAEVAIASGRPLSVVPGGTLNHFARDAGLEDETAAVEAVRAGTLAAVDVGLIAGKPFLNTASFGSYADFVDARERLEPRLGKKLAALIAAIRVLRRAEPVCVELDGVPRRIWMIFVGNCEYEPPGFAPRRRPRLDDGNLDVRYIDASARASRTRFVGALLLNRLPASPVFHRSLLHSVDVHSQDGPLRLARDGETFDGGTDVTIAKHPDRLAVYTPRVETSPVSPRPPA